LILTKFCINDNIIKTHIFYNMMLDLKGNVRSNKALYIYLFSSNNSSVKPTLPLMISLNFTKRERDGSLFCSLDVGIRHKFFIKLSMILKVGIMRPIFFLSNYNLNLRTFLWTTFCPYLTSIFLSIWIHWQWKQI
jgi:hypothetical protein